MWSCKALATTTGSRPLHLAGCRLAPQINTSLFSSHFVLTRVHREELSG